MKWNSYEISLWTHQEVYLATLCNSLNFRKYDANSPILNCSTTGLSSLTFSIPIVCYNLETGELEDNTIWYNKLKTDKSLANEKRVKLIFDKAQSTMRIMEFVITTMELSRNGELLYCNVTCSGLAFKWLGKIGYDITLDSETMLLLQEELDKGTSGKILYPTINYWLDKVFPNHKGNNDNIVWDTFWRYEIKMNYGACVGTRENDKVYLDDDIVSWSENSDGTFSAVYNTLPIEKERFILVLLSNKYNITQDIAEEFEVYARYEFIYDDESNPYKATAGKVVFYNELTLDTEYVISYGNNETGLTKTSESSDIVTKMYVNPVEDEYSDSGYVSLSQAAANKMGLEYLFNFNYYIASGLMTTAQQAAITTYENKIRQLNTKLDLISAKRNEISDSLIDDSVTLQNAYDTMIAAQTLVNDYNSKLNIIMNQLTTSSYKMQETVTLARQLSGTDYVFNFTRSGIINGTISCTTLSNVAVTGFINTTDQFGNVVSVTFSNTTPDTMLKFTYTYDLVTFYTNAIQAYKVKANLAQSTYERYYSAIGDEDVTEGKIDGTYYLRQKYWEDMHDSVAEQKLSVINDFLLVMGYFIKLGKWDASNFSVSYLNKAVSSGSSWNCGYMAANFSDAAKDSLTHSYYESGTNLDKIYYDFIELDLTILKGITNYDLFSILLHYTGNDGVQYTNIYTNSAHGSIQFLKVYSTNGTDYWVIPVFIFENSDRQINPKGKNTYLTYRYYSTDSEHSISYTKFHRIGSTLLSGDYSYNNTFQITDGTHISTVSAAGTVVYRRIKLLSENISDTSIVIKTNNGDGIELDLYLDYLYYTVDGLHTINFKISNSFPAYLDTTVLPVVVSYKVDRSSQQLYYDAKDVLKNSAFPEVSYEVEFSYLKQCKHYRDDYFSNNDNIDLLLGCIVRINDVNMGLRNVKGIVTEYSIDIDSPQNTKFTISNYKTRFEDLFGRIVALTQALLSNTGSYLRAASAITADGQIKASILQASISNNSLIFNSGYNTNVTWNLDGILAENSLAFGNGVTGQVAIKGSGILLSNTIDDNGNRLYTTAITADGINASAMTVGRLDTEKINIYSGDEVKFMWNAEGLFAYGLDASDDNDQIIGQYICYNEEGLNFFQNKKPIVQLNWLGLYIGAQDGAVLLTGDNGLVMYNREKYDSKGLKQFRTSILLLGKNDLNNYGLRLYKPVPIVTDLVITGYKHAPTLLAEDDGTLWLKDRLLVGEGSSMSGISAEGATTYNNQKEVINSPIRFWAGAAFDARSGAAFWVKEDGTLHATNAYIEGQVTATSGSIGGWTISNNQLSTVVDDDGNASGAIVITDKLGNVLTSIGSGGMKFTGEIQATSGSFSGNIDADSATIGNVSVASLLGNQSVINIKILSSNGNVTKYGLQFSTILTAIGYIGNVQFSNTDYSNYDYLWQTSPSGAEGTWTTVSNNLNQRTYTINKPMTSNIYYRCKVTKKE